MSIPNRQDWFCNLCKANIGDERGVWSHTCRVKEERKRLARILRSVAGKEEGWGTDPAAMLCQVAELVESEEA